MWPDSNPNCHLVSEILEALQPMVANMDSRAKSFLARFFGRNKQLGHKGSFMTLKNPDPLSKALEIELINRCGGISLLDLPYAFAISNLAVPVCIAAASEYLINNGET